MGGETTSSAHHSDQSVTADDERLVLAGDLARETLETFPDPVALTTAVRDDNGRIVDFRLRWANKAAVDLSGRSMTDLVGKTATDAYPAMMDNPEMFTQWVRVVDTGEPFVVGAMRYDARVNGRRVGGWFEAKTVRIENGCMHTWRDVTELIERESELRNIKSRLEETQRLAHLGSWRYDVDTERLQCSNELFDIIGLVPSVHGLTFDAALMLVAPEDRAALRRARHVLNDRTCPFSLEQKIRRPDGQQRILLVNCEPVLDSHGMTTSFRGTVQDITEQRFAAFEAARKDATLRRQADELQTEQAALRAVQKAVLPEALPEIKGLLIGASTRAANDHHHVQIGGDWYDVFEVDDEVVVVLGDVTGHGLEATRLMSQLRDAARAYCRLGLPPSGVLAQCNRYLVDFGDGHSATMALLFLSPETGSVRWAQAGHLPPLITSPGGARFIDRPDGILLGAANNATFDNFDFVLDQGATLIAYSDGLVETRDEDLDVTLEHLLANVRELPSDAPQEMCAGLIERAVFEGRSSDDMSVLAVRRTR